MLGAESKIIVVHTCDTQHERISQSGGGYTGSDESVLGAFHTGTVHVVTSQSGTSSANLYVSTSFRARKRHQPKPVFDFSGKVNCAKNTELFLVRRNKKKYIYLLAICESLSPPLTSMALCVS